MSGTWPNLDASDLELRVRTYLSEAAANFYTQAAIWRWLSAGARDIAEKTLCVRRVLDAVTASSTRTVTTYCYKVINVEYIPSTGRPLMLAKISPLKLGHVPLDGTAPQYWYENGSTIGIEPLPNGVYNLRLYVADLPKIIHTTYPISTWSSGWTGSGTGTWTNGASAVYTGTTGQTGMNTWGTALTTGLNYTLSFTVSGISNCSLIVSAGTGQSNSITTNGYHTFNLTVAGTTNLIFTAAMSGATGGVTVDDLYISKEDSISSATDQIELPSPWQHLMVLYAVYHGLIRDKKIVPAKMIEDIYESELAYLRRYIVEHIPDGKRDIRYD